MAVSRNAVANRHCAFYGAMDAWLTDRFGAKVRTKAKDSFGFPTLKDIAQAYAHSLRV